MGWQVRTGNRKGLDVLRLLVYQTALGTFDLRPLQMEEKGVYGKVAKRTFEKIGAESLFGFLSGPDLPDAQCQELDIWLRAKVKENSPLPGNRFGLASSVSPTDL